MKSNNSAPEDDGKRGILKNPNGADIKKQMVTAFIFYPSADVSGTCQLHLISAEAFLKGCPLGAFT